MSASPLEAARDSGLVAAGEPLLVMLSGGGDSVCLLDVALRLNARVAALHVNYGLRPGAEDDERFVLEFDPMPITKAEADRPGPGTPRRPEDNEPCEVTQTLVAH